LTYDAAGNNVNVTSKTANSYPVYTIEQTSSKCIQNARAIARRLLNRVNGVLAYQQSGWVVWRRGQHAAGAVR